MLYCICSQLFITRSKLSFLSYVLKEVYRCRKKARDNWTEVDVSTETAELRTAQNKCSLDTHDDTSPSTGHVNAEIHAQPRGRIIYQLPRPSSNY